MLTDEFAAAAAEAGRRARNEALASGHSVVFVDMAGQYVLERPDGRLFEVRLDSTQPRESHCVVVREIFAESAA
ncbi:MAG: hypothetical protein IT162_09190 [Bryobacterales bacterium]|nr:hypothetical protein [Bryobacterales bacterium]